MRRVIYLSGTIANLTYEQATAKRNETTKLLLAKGWDVLDPMRGKEILSTMKVIDEEKSKELLGGVTDAAIVQRDYDDVRRADAIIVLSGDKPSWGTAYEWALAHFLFQKPVVVVASKDNPTRHHPWCKVMSSYFAETVEEAVEFIDRWLDRGYQLDKEPKPPLPERVRIERDGLQLGYRVYDDETGFELSTAEIQLLRQKQPRLFPRAA